MNARLNEAQMERGPLAATSKASQEKQQEHRDFLASGVDGQASAPEPSIFAEFGWKYIERGISVVPIAAGSKKPGQWSQADGWRGMSEWTRFSERMPTSIELEHWERWPNSGIGVVCGKLSRIVALDKDYDLPAGGNDALNAIIPYSPVAKKGEKGWTKFYLYNGEPSKSFDVGGHRVLDILSDGRQTVVPPTAHPSGCNYVWLSEETLDNILSVDELPRLPDDFIAQVERVLAPYQTEEDRQYQKPARGPKDTPDRISGDRSIQEQYFHDLNQHALANLGAWVPKIVPTAKPHAEGYRAIATWRGAKNPNVGIHPDGIMDWGGNYGMTPIDLVMYANGLTFAKATESLRLCLPSMEPEPITMTVGGVAIGAAPGQPTPAPQPPMLPWLKAKPQSVEAPAPVILPATTSFDPAPAVPAFITGAPGILGDIARWITATAPRAQPELSLAAAIALCSVVMGRCYRSQYGNFTSLFLIMIAKSGEGKEHPQECVGKVLTAAGLQKLIGGSGYTSPGAIHTALMRSPAHIATIDEMGKLLKSSRAKGNAHGEAAIDKLLECFGRQDSVLRPPTYSSMSDLAKASQSTDRVVHNPAITLLGATTPGTFYENLTTDLVQDGFLGRCIVVESKQPRQVPIYQPKTHPPQKIIDWCKAVHATTVVQGDLGKLSLAEQEATTIELRISDACMTLVDALNHELVVKKDSLNDPRLDVVLNRTAEKAMKLAMIVCKAENPGNTEVMAPHMAWAINYVRQYDYKLVDEVEANVSENEFQKEVKKILKWIRGVKSYKPGSKQLHLEAHMKAGMMPHTVLLKLSHMKARQFSELMDTLVETKAVIKLQGELLQGELATQGALYQIPED